LIAGVGMVYYHRELVKWFGRSKWAEDILGGTEQMYILLGMLLMIVGFVYIFNAFF